jgi:4-hydroxy 2-oxovalerate aldolase
LPSNKIKKREVLMLASGPKIKDYKNEIEKYIKIKKPFVMALNTDVIINKKLIDVYVACNPLNLIADADLYKNLSSPLIVPKSLLSNQLKKKLKRVKILDFGVGVKENTFEFFKKGATLPRLYTLGYALAIATSGKASRVLLAGFDGYGPNNVRTKEINKLFYSYSSTKNSKQLISITPTSYSISSSSIYAF